MYLNKEKHYKYIKYVKYCTVNKSKEKKYEQLLTQKTKQLLFYHFRF